MSRRRLNEGSCYEDVTPPLFKFLFILKPNFQRPVTLFSVLCQLVPLYCWRLHIVCPLRTLCKSTVFLYCFYFRFAPFLWLPITIKCKTAIQTDWIVLLVIWWKFSVRSFPQKVSSNTGGLSIYKYIKKRKKMQSEYFYEYLFKYMNISRVFIKQLLRLSEQ